MRKRNRFGYVDGPREASPELRKAVGRFVSDDKYRKWLATPNRLMGNQIPQKLINWGREEVVWEAVRIARGTSI